MIDTKITSIINGNGAQSQLEIRPRIPIPEIPKRVPRLLIAPGHSPAELARSFRTHFPGQVRNVREQAERICAHELEIFGANGAFARKQSRPAAIDWHSDPFTGYYWPADERAQNIRYGLVAGVDIKSVWELARFHHFHPLGQAYVLTHDEKYFREFVAQIVSWIVQNPVGYGVHWKSTMEVAIRVSNWLVSMEYFAEILPHYRRFLRILYHSIYEHALFIHRRFSKTKITENHYLLEVAGLFLVSIYCPFFREADQWQMLGRKELIREGKRQILPDGGHFEASTSYHRFALEAFLYTAIVALRVGIQFPEEHLKRIHRMCELTRTILKPDQTIPQVGDNDSGRFLELWKRPSLEHGYLLSLAGGVFEQSPLNTNLSESSEEAFWVFGQSKEKSGNGQSAKQQSGHVTEFPYTGLYIIRNGQDYCCISCAENGYSETGGHAHNDNLSLELSIDGSSLFVDPGTGTYTGNKQQRNQYRSTALHNTLIFRDIEQNKLTDNPFWLPFQGKILEAEISETQQVANFSGAIEYHGIKHTREVRYLLTSRRWFIHDEIESEVPVTGTIAFHLAPTVHWTGAAILDRKTGKALASLGIPGFQIRVKPYDYSPGYGEYEPAECIFAEFQCAQQTVIETVIARPRKPIASPQFDKEAIQQTHNS